ncbi:MAG: DNA polymerase/3'-5' exonuclease PolX [Anaerolineales bacterium]|jgi:DNA polymerase (family 10)
MSTQKGKYSNQELANIFESIADLLEIKGEVVYKTLAYRKASDSLNNLARDVNDIWQEGDLTEIPGVGKAIAEKIDELLSTGKLEFFEKLENEVPPGLLDVLKVPDVGPKKAALFWHEAGISNLEELEEAARQGNLRKLPGMGEKSEAKIIAGLEALSRRSGRIPLGDAWPFGQELIQFLHALPDVVKVEAGGSLRRMRETVGDLDLLAAAENSKPVMDAFSGRPDVVNILSKGETKTSLEFNNGIRAQLWVHPPERFGTALQYATGSKDHNVRLRELALKQGLSLSDQSYSRENGKEILCADEEEVYRILDIPWIPPELREDRGEVEAAIAGNLPDLITVQDIQSDLHTHSTWSDGTLSIKEMAQAALRRGLKVLAITDHSKSLGIAGGLSEKELLEQRQEIDKIQEQLGVSLQLLQGSEVEIRADGSLDYSDEVLAKLDIVIASLHTSLRQNRQKITSRLIKAIENPYVDLIAHPTGRMIPDREGADLDMDAVLEAALEHGVVLEINAHPARLDLNDIYARRAADMGIRLSINTDAHSESDLDLLHFGVATARRGWISPEVVVNTWDTKRLTSWLESRP